MDYRADRPKLDNENWHAFTVSSDKATTNEWRMEKIPVHHIID